MWVFDPCDVDNKIGGTYQKWCSTMNGNHVVTISVWCWITSGESIMLAGWDNDHELLLRIIIEKSIEIRSCLFWQYVWYSWVVVSLVLTSWIIRSSFDVYPSPQMCYGNFFFTKRPAMVWSVTFNLLTNNFSRSSELLNWLIRRFANIFP